MMNNTNKHQVVPIGTRVRVTRPFRVPVKVSGPDAFKEWVDWPAGCLGLVVRVTNAGFRGIEHEVWIDGPQAPRIYAHNVAASDMEVLP